MAILGQGLTLVTGLVSIPLTVRYLGPPQYGVWVTLSTVITWLGVSDIGFGSALVNALAEADGADDRHKARGLVATAFWAMVLVALLVMTGGLIIATKADVAHLLGAGTAIDEMELRSATAVAVILFGLSFPTGLVDSIYRGYQEGYKAQTWGIAGSLLSLVALLAVVQQRGGLPLLVMALMGSRTLVRFANIGYALLIERPWLLPVPTAFASIHLGRLWRLGSYYLVQQVGNIAMFQAQPLIIAHLNGPLGVGQFNVAYKLMTLPQQLMIVLFAPLIASYGEAVARNDWNWIRATAIWTTVAGSGLGLILTTTLVVVAPILIPYWTGPDMFAGVSLIIWLAVFVVASGLATPISVLLQGLERAQALAALTIGNGIATIGLSLWLVRAYGPAGMGAAMAIAVVVVTLPGLALAMLAIRRLRHPA